MKKRKRVARAKVRCYVCGRPTWVSENDEPDKVLIKHRFQRCKGKAPEQWEKDRRRLYFGDEKITDPKPAKGKRPGKKERRRREDS